MTYQGWSLDSMRAAGSGMEPANGLIPEHTHYPISSFTPVNAGAAPVQYISPQRTLHDRDLYDLVEFEHQQKEYTSSVLTSRSCGQLSKGRAVSIDPLWEYIDEGDLAGQNNGDDFQTKFPKRNRSGYAKRATSMKLVPKNISQLWSPDEDHNREREAQDTVQVRPNMDNLPETGTKKQKRAISLRPASTNLKMGPFKLPTITKAAMSKEKYVEKPTPQQAINSYQGYMTTQDSVKLAKTTLDKLAAFRYVPPASACEEVNTATCKDDNRLFGATGTKKSVETPTSLTSEAQSNSDVLGGYIDDMILDEPAGNHPISFDVALEQMSPEIVVTSPGATWTGHLDSQASFSNYETHLASSEPHSVNKQIHNPPGKDLSQTPRLPDDLFDSVGHICSLAQEPRPDPIIASHTSSQYDEPNSSQERAISNLMHDPFDVSLAPGIGPTSASHLKPSSKDREVLCDAPNASHQSPRPVLGEIDEQILSDLSLARVLHTDHDHDMSDSSTRNRLGHVDSDELEIIVENVLEGTMDDEFDEGLDDSDFMELLSQPVSPVQLPGGPAAVGCHPILMDAGIASQKMQELKDCCRKEDTTITSTSDQSDGSPLLPSRDAVSDSDMYDEFPLDDEIEAELMQLDEPGVEVVERFEPPPSVQDIIAGFPFPGEEFDKRLQFSSPVTSRNIKSASREVLQSCGHNNLQAPHASPAPSEEDWSFLRSSDAHSDNEGTHIVSSPVRKNTLSIPATEISPVKCLAQCRSDRIVTVENPVTETLEQSFDGRHEFEPLKPFARPDFPALIQDQSPVFGLLPQVFLRVCFRIGEMLKEGSRCHVEKEDAVIELYARIIHSAREPGTNKQTFQFADLWHDRPPFPTGILTNYKTSELAQKESKVFLEGGKGQMARCFGRLKRNSQNTTGWLLDIISIRPTDWEEIRWTKRIVSAGRFKSETKGPSKL